MDAYIERPTLAARSSTALDRIETIYLKVLRATLLIVATLLLLCAIVWAVWSLTQVLKSPESVIEKPSAVASTELISSEISAPRLAGEGSQASDYAGYRSYYDGFIKRYFAVYRAKYEPSLRKDDKRLTIGEFDDLTVNTGRRLAAVQSGEMDFVTDRSDLESYLPVITQASSSKSTADRLAKYRSARKQSVRTEVQRTRTETRRGWDSSSTTCEAWFEAPIGCAVTRSVEVPYTQRTTVMRYPDGIASPNDILKAYQDKYFGLLAERRQANAAEAEAQRSEIRSGQIAGWTGLSQSVLIVGAFLLLMFFFLLVAIERHQRRTKA